MKKTFWSFSLMSIVLRISMGVIGGAGCYVIVANPIPEIIIFFAVGLIVCFLYVLGYTYYKVTFLENGIKVFALIPFIVHQHRLFVEYSKIKELRLIMAYKNSKKRRMPSSARGMPPIYLCFVLGERTHEWVYVSAFSKKQINKMLGLIKDKTGLCYEYDDKHIELIDLNSK